MRTWEYRIVDSSDAAGSTLTGRKGRVALEVYLNQLGAEGWEIVNLDSLDVRGVASFVGVAKREK
ncbi:MAG: DUF4177 domain-containing protein [Thermodesulfovibrionales bacterium]